MFCQPPPLYPFILYLCITRNFLEDNGKNMLCNCCVCRRQIVLGQTGSGHFVYSTIWWNTPAQYVIHTLLLLLIIDFRLTLYAVCCRTVNLEQYAIKPQTAGFIIQLTRTVVEDVFVLVVELQWSVNLTSIHRYIYPEQWSLTALDWNTLPYLLTFWLSWLFSWNDSFCVLFSFFV